MTDDKTVSEDMLHAYVDGELAPEEAVRVEAWLAGHPDDAAAVAAWRLQNALVQEVFGSVPLQEDEVRDNDVRDHGAGGAGEDDAAAPAAAPAAAQAAVHVDETRKPGSVAVWKPVLAAAVAAFVVGVSAGVGLGFYLPSMRPEAGTIAEHARTAYRVYSVEKRHPVEVGPDEREHLVKWLSNRLETPLVLPDLAGQGLELVGGRLTAGDRGPAALFMFEASNGDRYTVYVARPEVKGQTAFRFDISGDVGTCYWLDNDLAVVVNGPADRERLESIATLVYDAYERVEPVL